MAYHIIRDYSPSDIEDFRSLKGKGGHFEKGLFIAEGEKVTKKVLGSSMEIASAYMTREHFEQLKSSFENRTGGTHGTDIFLASKEEMEEIIGYHLHQGVMLAVRIPKNRQLMEAVAEWKSPWIAVALDGIADAENMGGIIRNAAAFGAKAVIVDEKSCNPYLRRSVRVSMGTIVDVEIIFVEDLASSLKTIRSIRPMGLIGAALTEHSVTLAELEISGDAILVFGSEGWGLRKEVAEACDVLARIPMAEGIDSLNVGVASGIFMHWWNSAFPAPGAKM
ncbi:MAG: TrmH family RNA methyltransferase [Candidatus Kapaibacterium sp.]